MATRQKVSVEDYLALPEWEKPYREYLDGEVVPKMAPDFRHMTLAGEITYWLRQYSRAFGGYSGPEGRIEIRPGDGSVYFLLPDVAYWAAGRAIEGERAMLPPTLAVEVRSPGQPMASQRDRARLYRAGGVDACWLIDPEARTVEVYEGDGDPSVLRDTATLRSVALPGFEMDLAELFAVLDR